MNMQYHQQITFSKEQLYKIYRFDLVLMLGVEKKLVEVEVFKVRKSVDLFFDHFCYLPIKSKKSWLRD